jgi:small GTP-binding protein
MFLYYRNTNGVIIVYDVTSRSTLDEVDDWMNILVEHNITAEHIPIMLVGNKIDLERTIDQDEGRLLAKKHNIHYSETTAKQNIGLSDTFKTLAILVI